MIHKGSNNYDKLSTTDMTERNTRDKLISSLANAKWGRNVCSNTSTSQLITKLSDKLKQKSKGENPSLRYWELRKPERLNFQTNLDHWMDLRSAAFDPAGC